MTLQKGRLGIGTDEPQGRLAVLDEPHNLEEFPPRAMTDYKTYFEGHGEFCASASHEYTNTPRLTWKAFNKSSENIEDGWMHGVVGYTGASSGTAAGNTPTYNGSASLGGIGGDWISLEFPYKVKLNGFKITSYFDGTFRGLNDGFLLGRNDKNSEWTRVHEITNLYAVYGVRDAPQLSAEISFINDTYYNEYALIATSTTGHTVWSAIELRYFGTREQGQSVLHDGQLTLTKSLNVPRIGPPLDADDTPRRDRLVVEYNTSTNPTFEGAVRDTSGRGNDGVFYGGASYDATEKDIGFPSNSPGGAGVDYIRTKLNVNQTGDITHSASIWFKTNSGRATSWRSIFEITDAVPRVDTSTVLSLYIEGNTDKLVYITGTNYLYSSGVTLENFYGSWNHAVITYDGVNKRMYYNGSLIKTVAFTGWTGVANPALSIGMNNHANADQALDGSVSNFKCYYGHALTAEEVKTLYDMGRLGNAIKTPLQIETPIDIRGDIRYITNIRPLPQQTMWSHEANGNFTRGIYPITGTQGGSKVYNVLCEPDWCGGGWMCAAQLPRGKDVVTTTVNLFTADYGDPSNLTWSNDFAVPMNVFSNNSGYDLDVMLVIVGGSQAGRAGSGGARNGGIYRGVNLEQALNTGWPTNSVYPAYISTSGLASSNDGFHFVSRTPVGGTASSTSHFTPYKANTGWRLSFSSHGDADMAYNDSDINTMGWLVHTAGNYLQYTYSYVHGGGGSQNNYSGNHTDWAAIRIFVRPKRY